MINVIDNYNCSRITRMAAVRDLNNSDYFHTYLATVALFCGLSCTILMLKFKGFRASLNLSSGKTSSKKRYELAPQVSVSGAYRTSRDENFGNNLDSQKRTTPSTINLPPNTLLAEALKPSKSTSDLSTVNNAPANLRKSEPNVTVITVPSTRDVKNRLKEQKKIEKKRIEQIKREELVAQQREREEQVHKDMKAAQQQAKLVKERDKQRKKKTVAPQPQQNKPIPQQRTNILQENVPVPKQSRTPPPPQFKTMGQSSQAKVQSLSQNTVEYSTNTLESSISRSSGPPPYDNVMNVVPNTSDSTGNTSFAKSVDTSSSWDMITQHRQQISRTPGGSVNKSQQKQIDLQYSVGNITREDRDNSEA